MANLALESVADTYAPQAFAESDTGLAIKFLDELERAGEAGDTAALRKVLAKHRFKSRELSNYIRGMREALDDGDAARFRSLWKSLERRVHAGQFGEPKPFVEVFAESDKQSTETMFQIAQNARWLKEDLGRTEHYVAVGEVSGIQSTVRDANKKCAELTRLAGRL